MDITDFTYLGFRVKLLIMVIDFEGTESFYPVIYKNLEWFHEFGHAWESELKASLWAMEYIEHVCNERR